MSEDPWKSKDPRFEYVRGDADALETFVLTNLLIKLVYSSEQLSVSYIIDDEGARYVVGIVTGEIADGVIDEIPKVWAGDPVEVVPTDRQETIVMISIDMDTDLDG